MSKFHNEKLNTQNTVKTDKLTLTKNHNPSISPRNIFILVFTLLIFITAGLVGYKAYKQSLSQKQSVKRTTAAKQVLVRRSVIPNVIVSATTAKTIDVKTGKVILAARVFSVNDKTVYLALDLNSANSGTNIDYIRYLNGRYVDHGNVKLDKNAVDNINFSWTNVRSLGSVADGKWKVATYTNGILEKRVNYTVTKNVAWQMQEDQDIYPSNPDYYLGNSLAAVSSQIGQ